MQLLLLLLLLLAPTPSPASPTADEDFAEALLLKPLPDRKVLAHFHFRTSAPSSPSHGLHHRLFPKAIAQLIRKFGIREMELSFTQGRWSYERWGASDPLSSANAKPPGVELWTLFDLPEEGRIDPTWKHLTHALSGLFCSSINFLEFPTAHAAPRWAHVPNSGNLRYGALPREAVCTENLTPWLKLLPCRDKAGIASLLDRPSVYKGSYHSQRLRLTLTESNAMVIEQALTVVLQPGGGQSRLPPDWSIGSLLKRKVGEQCVLAKSSLVFVELESGLVAQLEKVGPRASWDGPGFELSHPPDDVISSDGGSVLYKFDLVNRNKNELFDFDFSWKQSFVWSCSRMPLQANRFLMGSGNERGSIVIRLMAVKTHELFRSREDGLCVMDVSILQIVPWYVKVYYHTLKIVVDGKSDSSSVIEKIQVSPSEDKLSPGVMELMLKLPCAMDSVVIMVDFDKGFLHIDEYPPDANQGFDIPSAIIGFPNFSVGRQIFEESFTGKDDLVRRFEERSAVRSYTEILLVPLTTPDFSMPYNVITFTCTVLALYFGSLLNVLRRRVGEEDRLLCKGSLRQGLLPRLVSILTSKLRRGAPKSSMPSSTLPSSLGSKQLLKVIMVALAAVLWYYLKKED